MLYISDYYDSNITIPHGLLVDLIRLQRFELCISVSQKRRITNPTLTCLLFFYERFKTKTIIRDISIQILTHSFNTNTKRLETLQH
jgi:hypothetical protein